MQQNHPQYAESLNRWHFLQSNHGTLGNLIATTDWSFTSLGPIEQWPQSLKTAISIILNTQHPMFIAWGAERIFIYNDAYIQVLSTAKHPWALGRPFAEVWAEIWDTCGPLTEKVFKHAQASFADNVQLFMKRADYLEETYYSFSYSPIRDESGDVMGLFCPSLETTEMMLSERRLKTLGDISAKVLLTKTIKGACELAIATLGENKNDIPFALLYLIDESNKTATLMQSIGLAGGDAAVNPVLVEFENPQANQTIWPISEVITTSTARLLNVTSQTVLPLGLAAQQITQAILLPVILTGQDKPIGVLISGINPCRKFDQTYRTFFDLIIGQMTTAIQNAKACEEEKIRLERLAEVDKAKTLFFSNVSHEFRTPLTLIQGPLEDALADTMHPLPPIQRERLLLMQRNTLRLFKLVNSLLDFSRIEASRMQAIYEPVNITQLTIDLVSVFRSMLEKAGLQLILDIKQIDELVYLDKEMFEKIIFNLLSNAFKFTLQGSITVLLCQQDDKVQLQVKDTGSGIPTSELPKMFERFHRIEGSQGRSYEGSGIGLALVAELVKLHSGTIDIESELGHGSTFILKFPLGINHLPEQQLGKRASHTVGQLGVAYVEEAMHWLPEVPPPSATPMDIVSSTIISPELDNKELISHAKSPVHILLADDNPDMREYVKGLLLSAGWQVNAVTNGEEALHAALANPPDLLLSDVMMPKLDGMQLIAQLRQQPITQLIPMLLLSARAGEESRVEGMTTGADDYLVKPFSAKELLARVKAHLELGQLRIQLEKRVKERTLELENSKAALQQEMHERLQTEKQLAEEHTRAQLAEHYRRLQADFMDTLCHEIRNPLNGIYGGVNLLQDRLIKLEQFFKEEGAKLDLLTAEKIYELLYKIKEDLQSIEQCSEQQKIIVNDVLDLSKLENNKVELNLVPGDIKQVINNIIQMFNAIFEEKKLKIQVDFSQTLALILKMDMHRLSQIVTNLISNAVKFTKQGTVHIIVSIAPLSNSECILEVQVKDTGIGMTDDEINGLFNKFSQANRRITSEYGGSGLGLVISQKLVNLMGGELKVESQKWHGTCFTFTAKAFVLTAEELKQWQSTQQQRHSSQTNLPQLQGKSILIVEDNLINQRILRNYLEQKGCFCQIAENGQQALDKAAQFKFDLIFMDIEMPVMGGIEATQKLREQKENSLNYQVPIVGLSGNARKEQIEQAKQAGMNDYLTKPYNKEAVYTVIQDYTRNFNTLQLIEAKDGKVNLLNISEHFKQNAAQLLKQNYPFNVSYRTCQIIFELPIAPPLFTEYLCQLILNDLKIHLEKIAQFFEINNILLTNNQLVIVSSSIEKAELLKQFLNEVKLIKEFKSTSPLLRPINIFNISSNKPERLFSLKRAKIGDTPDTVGLTSLPEKSLQELIEKLNTLLIQFKSLSKDDNDYINIIETDLQYIQTKDQPLVCVKNHIYHVEDLIQKQNEIRKINQP